MNKNVIIFSIAVVSLITFLLIFSIFWIFFFNWGDTNSVKNSLSIVSGFFGGIATLGAAVIAAYLFNDWKAQKKYEIVSTLALEAHMDFIHARDRYMFYLMQFHWKTPEITYKAVDDEVFRVISKLNLLNAILERFKFNISLNSEIETTYNYGYCKIETKYRNFEILKHSSEDQLKTVYENAFPHDANILQKLLDIIEKVEERN